MQAKTHYDSHLAAFYSWMLGDFDAGKARMRAYFNQHHIKPHSTRLAVDLGAGTGLQTLALAELGFRVAAVDFSEALLAELRQRADGFSVTTHQADLLTFIELLGTESPELIVCMGDTLPHLDSIADVTTLLENCRTVSLATTQLVLSYRPLLSELHDTQRFIPVRADHQRIHTCVLDYFPEWVRVTDLIHERDEAGNWQQKVSAYNKLRLSEALVTNLLQQTGWQLISQHYQQGMVYQLATPAK